MEDKQINKSISHGDMGDQDKIIKTYKKSETLIITPDKTYNLNDDIDDERTGKNILLMMKD